MLPTGFSIYRNVEIGRLSILNRLKPCSKKIRLENSDPLVTVPTPPAPTDVQPEDQNDIELADYLDDVLLEASNTQQST